MATAPGTVGVQPANAAVRPGVGVNDGPAFRAGAENFALVVALELALPAAVDGVGLVAGHAGDFFGEHVVEAGEDFTRLGVVTVRELPDLRLMTLAAILGRDEGGDPHAFVFPRADAVRLRDVTIQAADFDFRVTRTPPFHDEGRGGFGVAIGAGLVLRGGDGLRHGSAGFAPGEEQQRGDGERGKAGKNR